MHPSSLFRATLPSLTLCLFACQAGGVGPQPAASSATPAPVAARAEIQTARVRLAPAQLVAQAPVAGLARAAEAPHLFSLARGAWEVPLPRNGNGLYMVLATPEWPEAGTAHNMLVEGVLPNPPANDSLTLATPEATGVGSACGASVAEATDPAPPPARRQLTSVPAAADTERFWVIRAGQPAPPGEAYDEVDTPCNRVYTGTSCHVYLDARLAAPEAIAEAKVLGEAFDARLLPGVSQLFGPAPQPGIDGDPRVFLVVSPEVSASGRSGALAYFSRRDQRTRGDGTPSGKHSNQRDALFIDARTLTESRRADLYAAVAHELGHLIHFTRHAPKLPPGVSEKLWLEEALAMMASHACGYTYETAPSMHHHVAGFLAQPYKYSLTDWAGNPGQAGYGIGYLFLLHLYERHGPEVIRAIVDSAEVGKATLEASLRGRGSSFREAFGDWAVALLNDGLFERAGSPWAYPTTQLRGVTPHGTLKGPAAMRMGPEGAYVPRRADVAYVFHVKPQDQRQALAIRWDGSGLLFAIVP
jgi:hypothetical protein